MDYLILCLILLPYCNILFVIDDDSHGQMFHSKYFRKLRYFVQTGPDIENGTTPSLLMCIIY